MAFLGGFVFVSKIDSGKGHPALETRIHVMRSPVKGGMNQFKIVPGIGNLH